MTAASLSTRKANNRTGLWIFLRLLGGWATVAALAYFLWMPTKEWGWPTLLFVWVLATILADEFAGWFGYIALVLGVLPFLWHTPPERWFIIFPLVAGALFGLLIMKHSGGPFVLPFGAAIFAGAIIGAGKIGAKLDPSLTFVNNHTFQQTALLAMAIGVGFSFLRQLISMIWRWYKARRARLEVAAMTKAADVAAQTPVAPPSPTPAAAVPSIPVPPVATPPTPTTPRLGKSKVGLPVVPPAAEPVTEAIETPPAPAAEAAATAPVTQPEATKTPTIDLDLTHFEEPPNPPKG